MVDAAEEQASDLPGPANEAVVRWRAWPCASCGGRTTPVGLLGDGAGSNPEIPATDRHGQIEWRQQQEAVQLRQWVEGCPHTRWLELRLPEIGMGSEHRVLFDEASSEVVKLTLPGVYGDHYEIVAGRMTQFCCTPREYLLRLRHWEKLFSTAPLPFGLTDAGQIVSRQQFITGDQPSQDEVDRFLLDAGAVAVKRHCWLWKKTAPGSRLEIWIGDARSDNFVSAPGGIVPIDIRIWGVPI